MDRQDVLKRLLYPKCKTALEFKFDSLIANPLLSYITVQDIRQLNKIATSLKYSSKPKEKYIMIDNIMTARGFKKMASGTNRVTYRCLNDYQIVIKIAIDKVGLSDNGNEYRNQHLLKPFVTKCFEVSPCGTVGLFERVVPITSREEFVNISDDIFDLINNLIGKFVLEDIGEKFYMNYGIREGFGPVLLDYPYVFELDGRKLICNVPEPLELMGYCGGEIDYDLGYNDLVCKKCGKRYLATELKSESKSDKPKIIIEGEDMIMKCVLKRGDEIVAKLNSEAPTTTNTIRSKKDFVKLKAQVTPKTEEKEEEFRHEIKTRDDVQLRAKLRGNRTSKDIDKEAIEREAKLDANSEKIQVSFEPMFKETPINPVSKFSVELSKPFIEPEKTLDENINEEELSEVKSDVKLYSVIIKENGEIWEENNEVLIGYTVEAYNDKINHLLCENTGEGEPEPSYYEENSKSDELVYSDYEEETGTTIGDLIGNSQVFKGNENYKTTDIVSPIEGYFSSVEETKDIPEVIIHAREEEEEDSYEYEYDPEYSGEDEEENESDPLAGY